MKYRYLIERNPATSTLSVYLSQIGKDGEEYMGCASWPSVEAAQAAAQEGEDDALIWKDPPGNWQPDAILVSQYLDDGIATERG